MAKAMVVCEEGQPQNIPPRKNPNRNPWLVSTSAPWPGKSGGGILPVNAL